MHKTGQQSVCVISDDAEFEQQIEGYFARNFLVNALDWAFFSLGMSFASVGTILPVYVSHLTSSKVLIGLVSTMANMGWFLPQIVTAPLLERLARRKPLVLVEGAVERLPFLLLASATFWLASASKGLLLVIFFGLLACHSFAGGLGGTAWQDLMGKIIPLRRRGRFFGMSNLISGVLGVGGAVCARSILAWYPYATNFALCFFIAFVAMSISWCFLALTKERLKGHLSCPGRGGVTGDSACQMCYGGTAISDAIYQPGPWVASAEWLSAFSPSMLWANLDSGTLKQLSSPFSLWAVACSVTWPGE